MSDIPNVIKTMAEYETIMARIRVILYAKPNTPNHDELKLLLKLTYDYEEDISNDDKGQQMSDIPTPRTDKQLLEYKHLSFLHNFQIVFSSFACELEREIAVKDAEIERLRDLLRFAWADDDLAEFSKSARRAYIDAIRAELGMEASK